MLKFNDIFAFIEVDGQELTQYGIEIFQEDNTIICWVVSQPGKNFSLTYGHDRPNDTFDIDIITDGVRYAKLLEASITGTTLKTTTGVATSPTTTRPYVFAKLQFTDDDEYLDKENHTGEIRLDFFRSIVLEKYPMKKKRYDVCDTRKKVHTRAKKTLAHFVSFGCEVSTSTIVSCRTRRLDANPLASFIFKCRTQSILRANGLMPRPKKSEAKPSRHTAEEKRSPSLVQQGPDFIIENDEDDEEMRTLDANIRASRRLCTALKKELASLTGSGSGSASASASASRSIRDFPGSLPPAKRAKLESAL